VKRAPMGLLAYLLLLTLPVEALVLLLFGVWMVRAIEQRDLDALDASLQTQSRDLLMDAAEEGGRLRSRINDRALAPGTRACVLGENGAVLWETPPGWFAQCGLEGKPLGPVQYSMSRRMGGERHRVFARATRLLREDEASIDEPTGPLITVVLSVPLTDLDQADALLRRKALTAGAALLALTALLLFAAIRLGLRPAAALVERLSHIPGPQGLERLDADRVPHELLPLAHEINGLLDRISELMARQERFTAEAAHELRTPLTLVKSTLQTALLAGDGRDGLEAALRESLEDLERLERTAESLLELARLDTLIAKPEPRFEEIDLAALLRQAAERFGSRAEERSMEIALALDPCMFRGNRDALMRLLDNLIANALTYAKAGGTVTLRCGLQGDCIEAAVEDEGPPIPESERERLFERFYRGASARKAESSGTGLGLAIAEAAARLHGGGIACEPCGEGNRFVVTLFRR